MKCHKVEDFIEDDISYFRGRPILIGGDCNVYERVQSYDRRERQVDYPF